MEIPILESSQEVIGGQEKDGNTIFGDESDIMQENISYMASEYSSKPLVFKQNSAELSECKNCFLGDQIKI